MQNFKTKFSSESAVLDEMATRRNLKSPFLFSLLFAILFLWNAAAIQGNKDESGAGAATLVTKEQRRTLVSTDSGKISAIEICDATGRPYHLQFITLDPNSLFLPVLLHADMVFYVHTGSGSLSWVGEDGTDDIQVKRGDVYRLQAGSVFFVRSSLEPTRERLRIYAIFTDISEQNPYVLRGSPSSFLIEEPYIGAYSMITDLVLGFDDKTLQSAFEVPEEVIEEILSQKKPQGIVHVRSMNESETEQPESRDWRAGIIESLIGPGTDDPNSKKKKKKTKIFNLFTAKPDFENCNGWSLEVNPNDLPSLKGSNVGVFMVNLTKGSMMGPHWNPRATEIAIVIQGQGMIRVVRPSINSGSSSESECKNMRFRVSEGDVFAVSRFHPMAQMSFNNDSLVFMGFSTMAAKNYPQFLAGRSSVLRTLDRDILAMAFNVPISTIDQLLAAQNESIILDCTSCAEEEEAAMEEEIEKERQEEEERKREEEEEEARRREEEEEARKREEEEARRRQEEEERKRKEEEEEEARRREEEEEAAAARRRQEEEERKREEEEEEEARRREEEEEEEARRREEEEEEEEAEARRREKERRRKEARRREEEEEEEEARRREEEEEEEEARRREEEEEEEEEEARRREEEEEEEEARGRRRRQEEEEEEEGRDREADEAGRPVQQRRNWWSKEEEARRKGGRHIRQRVEREGGGGGEPRKVLMKLGRI